MTATLTSALLALAIAQAAGPSPQAAGEGAPPAGGSGAEITTPPPARADEENLPQGVPYMPSAGPTQGSDDGVFLDLALLSEVRARTLAMTATETTWGTDLEVTPGIALQARASTFTLSLGYAPRLTVPFNVGTFELAVLNRATLLSTWRASPLWSLTASGLFVVGDYSQLVPASTPGGAGPPPPTLNPIRSFETYPYVGIDTLLRADGELSVRSRIRLGGGYFDVGGVGSLGQASQPRGWGPQAEGAFEWDASRSARLITAARAQDWMMVGDWNVVLATLTEGWRQSWSSELATTLSAGLGLSNRDIESRTASGHLAPVVTAHLDYRQATRNPLHVTLDAALAPYIDTYVRVPYQRFTFGGSLNWIPGDAWRVGASLSAALVPYVVQATESYGTGGLSASFAPVPFLVFTLGGFAQAQFLGASTSDVSFRQWSAYFSVALRDQISL